MKTTMTPLPELAASLGFTIESSPAKGQTKGFDGKEEWLNLAYEVSILRDGKKVWTGPYFMGIGCVKPKKSRSEFVFGFTSIESHLYSAWTNKPHANYVEKEALVSMLAKVANKTGVKPELATVLHSLLSDGAAYFDATTFEDWCSEMGSDPDSHSAEATWKACDEIGRSLARNIPEKELAQLRESASEF